MKFKEFESGVGGVSKILLFRSATGKVSWAREVVLHSTNCFFLFWSTSVLFVRPLIPLFWILLVSALGFNARLVPSLACPLDFAQRLPQIHL